LTDKLSFFAVCHTKMDSLNRGINSIEENVNLLTSFSHVFKSDSNNLDLPKNRNKLMIDSGAYDLLIRGELEDYPFTPLEYSKTIKNLDIVPDYVISMDYICNREENSDNYELINKTIHNAKLLRKEFKRENDICFVPVVQGYKLEDYLYCIEQLVEQKIVIDGDNIGIGSLVGRRGVKEPRTIIREVFKFLEEKQIKTGIHCFGVNLNVIKDEEIFNMISSIDSLAWTFPYRFGRVKVFTRGRMIEANSNGSLAEPEFYYLSLKATLKYIEFLNLKYHRSIRKEKAYDFRDLFKKVNKNDLNGYYQLASSLGIEIETNQEIEGLMKKILKQNRNFPRDTSTLLKKIPVFTGEKFLFLEPKNTEISKKEFTYLFFTAFKQVINKQSQNIEKIEIIEQTINNLEKEELEIINQEIEMMEKNNNNTDILDTKLLRKNIDEFEKKLNSFMNKLEVKVVKLRHHKKSIQMTLFEEIETKKDYYLLI